MTADLAGSTPETAAAITYEIIARPVSLPTDFVAPAGLRLRFLSIKAIDGFEVGAALWEPDGCLASDTSMLVCVHGSGQNYTRDPVGFLSRGVASTGRAVLAINTRQHDDGVNTDNFLDVRRDIEAAVYTARALGYRNLALHGHSLGNIQVQYFAATNWDPDIKGVVLTGMFANLPWKSRHLLIRDEPNYKELHRAAIEAVRRGRGQSMLPVQMGWVSHQTVPVSAQHFLTYRSDEASAADGTFWIKRIPRPILMVRDEGDLVSQEFEPFMLLSAATSEGTLVPDIKFVSLPSPQGPNPDGHGFRLNQDELIETVVGWLGSKEL